MEAVVAVEEARSRLVATSGLYAIRSDRDARAHLRLALAAYTGLAGRVAARDAVLDREIGAAFDWIDGQIARGAEPPPVRERIGLLTGQLLDGALAALLTRAAAGDPGVRAAALSRALDSLGRRYAEGVEADGDGAGRRAFQHAYGLRARARALSRGLADELGPAKDAVMETIAEGGERWFPLGVVPPPSPAAAERVSRATTAARRALEGRFRLDAPPA